MTNRIVLNETSYHGTGAVRKIADEAKVREFKKAFICSDPDPIKFNVTCRVTEVLEDAGLAYEVYSNIKPNSTIENVQTGVATFKASEADYTIAIGDGSSMNTSKAIDVIITNPELEGVRSPRGVAPTRNPCVSVITVPTTAGTAAEVTVNYAITNVGKKCRFMCVDTHDIPAMAVVDPEMVSSMPKGLTTAIGMDTLTHAIEGYTTKGVWEMTDMFNLKVIEVIVRSLRGAVENKPEDRGGMTLGQYLTGVGFSNCGLGIVYSMTRGLGVSYDTPRGVANAVILPTAMEYNAPCTGTKFKDIAAAMGVESARNVTQKEHRKATVDAIKGLSANVDVLADLKEIVKLKDMDSLSQSVMDGACHPGNPKDPSFEDIKNLYLSLM